MSLGLKSPLDELLPSNRNEHLSDPLTDREEGEKGVDNT